MNKKTRIKRRKIGTKILRLQKNWPNFNTFQTQKVWNMLIPDFFFVNAYYFLKISYFCCSKFIY